MAILIGLAVVLMLGGALFYNKLRAKVYGVIGVGGSYMALIGIAMLCALIATPFGGKTFGSTIKVIIGIILFCLMAGVKETNHRSGAASCSTAFLPFRQFCLENFFFQDLWKME